MNTQETKPFDIETAYIKVNNNYVEYSVAINEYVIAELDDEDMLVGVKLLSVKEIPSVEEIESHVDINWGDEETLERGLWRVGFCIRLQKAVALAKEINNSPPPNNAGENFVNIIHV